MKALKIFGVLFALLLVLVVALDFIGRTVAESKVADAFQQRYDLATTPDVDIHGFSFLTQALGGTYSDIEIQAADLPVPDIGAVDVTVNAQGLVLPMSKAIDGDVSSVPVERATASVSFPAAVIADRAGANVTLSSLGGTKVKVEASTTVVGVELPFAADLDISAVSGTVNVTVLQLSALDVDLPQEVADALSSKLTFSFDLPSVVAALELTEIAVTGDTVTLTGVATDVILN